MLELARAQDWEEVRRLSVQIHDLHAAWRPDIFFHTEEPYPFDAFLADIADRMVYVAKSQDRIVGYVTLSVQKRGGNGHVSQNALRLNSICVDEALRGQGIGTAMMVDVRALARAFGCKQLILGVHPENENAINFYRKCGYRLRTIHMDCNL